MTRHTTILTAFLIAASALAAGSSGCELIASIDRSKIPATGGSGGSTTTTTETTTTSTTSTTSCPGGAMACQTPGECPASSTACVTADCTAGCCSTKDATAGTACTDNGGKVCDGAGACVKCNQDADCMPTGTVCAVPKCDTTAHTCSNTNAAKGTACEGANNVCDGSGMCVAAHCTDGVIDADETDVDCGGSCGGIL